MVSSLITWILYTESHLITTYGTKAGFGFLHNNWVIAYTNPKFKKNQFISEINKNKNLMVSIIK